MSEERNTGPGVKECRPVLKPRSGGGGVAVGFRRPDGRGVSPRSAPGRHELARSRAGAPAPALAAAGLSSLLESLLSTTGGAGDSCGIVAARLAWLTPSPSASSSPPYVVPASCKFPALGTARAAADILGACVSGRFTSRISSRRASSTRWRCRSGETQSSAVDTPVSSASSQATFLRGGLTTAHGGEVGAAVVATFVVIDAPGSEHGSSSYWA